MTDYKVFAAEYDYAEIVRELRQDASTSRDLYLADAIEELQQTVEQMKAIVIAEAQHTEMFDERDKKTLMEMAKSLPLPDPPKEET